MDLFSLLALLWSLSGKRWNPRDWDWRRYGCPTVSFQNRSREGWSNVCTRQRY